MLRSSHFLKHVTGPGWLSGGRLTSIWLGPPTVQGSSLSGPGDPECPLWVWPPSPCHAGSLSRPPAHAPARISSSRSASSQDSQDSQVAPPPDSASFSSCYSPSASTRSFCPAQSLRNPTPEWQESVSKRSWHPLSHRLPTKLLRFFPLRRRNHRLAAGRDAQAQVPHSVLRDAGQVTAPLRLVP